LVPWSEAQPHWARVGANRVRVYTLRGGIAWVLAAVLPALGIYAASAGVDASSRRPNIIIFNTDDHPQWAVGAYGNKDVVTPNMDRLAREGMRFNLAFTKPVCSPSRAMTLTGLYSHRVGIPDYIPYGNPVYVDNGLPAGTPTIASVLKGIGYTSGMVGKWHLGYGEKYYPERFGFDVADGYHYVAPGTKYNGTGAIPFMVDGKEITGFRNQRQTDVLTDRAIHFIRANRERPFFLFFNTYVPHQSSWGTAPDEDHAHYKDRAIAIPDLSRFPDVELGPSELRQLMATLYAHVTCADRNLGRLLAALDELRLSDHTLLIFMGDNGMNLGHHGLIGKGNATVLGSKPRRPRPNMFDHSVRVPFIVRWPGVVPPASVSDAMISSMDILPTVIDITRVAAGQNLPLDGRSFLSLLRGEKDVPWREAYCDTYDMTYLAEAPMRMIRTDRWKLVLHFDKDMREPGDGRRHELFDLVNDPGELENLHGQTAVAAVQRDLEARLGAWMREVNVPPGAVETVSR
jgi:choline-sulfatase